MKNILKIGLLFLLFLGFAHGGQVEGLTGRYYLGDHFEDFNKTATKEIDQKPIYFNIDKTINFDRAHFDTLRQNDKTKKEKMTVVWDGYIKINSPNDYQFKVTKDDGAILYIDGKRILSTKSWKDNPIKQVHLSKTLTPIRLVYLAGGGEDNIKLSWGWSDKPLKDITDADLQGVMASKWLKTNTDDPYYPKMTSGLTGNYYKGDISSGFGATDDIPNAFRLRHYNDKQIDFWKKSNIAQYTDYQKTTVVWDGYVKIDEDGDYKLGFAHDAGVKLYVDEKMAYTHPKWTSEERFDHATNPALHLIKGYHRIKVVYYNAGRKNHDFIRFGMAKSSNYNPTENLTIPESKLVTLNYEPDNSMKIDIEAFKTEVDPDDTINIKLTMKHGKSGHLSYRTIDGTAKGGKDYESKTSMLYFDANNKTQTIDIKIKNVDIKDNKYFYVKFYNLDPREYSYINYIGSQAKEHEIKIKIIGQNENVRNEERDFSIRNPELTRNIKGNIAFIGNTILCPKDNYGNCIQDTTKSNADMYLSYINTAGYKDETGGDIKFNNSSKSKINIPRNAIVLWAGLYTQGYLFHINNNGTEEQISKDAFLQHVKLPINVKFPQIKKDFKIKNTLINYVKDTGYGGYTYGTFADVTKYFKDKKGNGLKGYEVNGWVTVMGIKSHYGRARNFKSNGLGNFGAWNLVIIYEDSTQSLKNISVFDGYKKIDASDENKNVFINIDGFLTPMDGKINSVLSVFAGEGDRTLEGDEIYLNGRIIGKRNNSFNSSIEGYAGNEIIREPSIANNQGIDIHNFDASSFMKHKQTSAVVRLTSAQDAYFPSVVAFSTELYEPKFCIDYAYGQSGIYFTEDNDGSKRPKIIGNVDKNIDVNVSLYLRSIEKTHSFFKDMELDIYDINVSQGSYETNSTFVTKRRQSIPMHIDDADFNVKLLRHRKTSEQLLPLVEVKKDGKKLIKAFQGVPLGSMSNADSVYMYYSIKPQTTKLDMPINARIRYKLKIAGFNGENAYEKILTDGKVKMCSTEDLKYDPIWGTFNVVSDGIYKALDDNKTTRCRSSQCPKFNIPTQVVGKKAEFNIVSHAKEPKVNEIPYIHEKAIPTIVGLDLFDASGFHDSKANCDEISQGVSKRFWISMFNDRGENISNKKLTQALQEAKKAGMIGVDKVEDYMNIALKNGSFRIITNAVDENGTFMSLELDKDKYKIKDYDKYIDWLFANAKDENNEYYENKESLPCKYDKRILIKDMCSADFMTYKQISDCSECLVGYNNINTCSRDNFAIRPESFYTQLRDINQTLSKLHDSGSIALNELLNTSKVFDPKLAELSSRDKVPTKIAGGYKYYYEFNATSHQDKDKDNKPNLKGVRGYTTSYPTKEDRDINSLKKDVFKWSSLKTNAVCNDVNDSYIAHDSGISFLSGVSSGKTFINNVGEYNLTIEDSKWTRVDWSERLMKHHKKAKILDDKKIVEKNVEKFFVDDGDGKDCEYNSTIVPKNDDLFEFKGFKVKNLNGCKISNKGHENKDTSIKYQANPYETRVYKFVQDLRNTFWTNDDINFTTIGNPNGGWMYMADINQSDANESVHFRGFIRALGQNDANMSNFVNACYARDVNITFDINNTRTSNTDATLPNKTYQVSFLDESGNSHYQDHSSHISHEQNPYNVENNTSIATLNIDQNAFYKELNGTSLPQINFGFVRLMNEPVNPFNVMFHDANSSCENEANCTMQADLNSSYITAHANQNYDANLTLLYARVFSPDVIGISPIRTVIRYEVYCDQTSVFSPCLNSVALDRYPYLANDNTLWPSNADHNTTTHGNIIGIGFERYNKSGKEANATRENIDVLTNGIEQNVVLTDNGGAPFVVFMTLRPSGDWLLFNPNRPLPTPTPTTNANRVEFILPGTWAGQGVLGQVSQDLNNTYMNHSRMEW